MCPGWYRPLPECPDAGRRRPGVRVWPGQPLVLDPVSGALVRLIVSESVPRVAGPDDEGPGHVVSHALVVPRRHHGDQAHEAEDEGVDDQQNAPDEKLEHARRAAVLADDPEPE